MANLQGASHLFVNGELFTGDVERRGYRGVPVYLRKGRNDVYALGIDGVFSLVVLATEHAHGDGGLGLLPATTRGGATGFDG